MCSEEQESLEGDKKGSTEALRLTNKRPITSCVHLRANNWLFCAQDSQHTTTQSHHLTAVSPTRQNSKTEEVNGPLEDLAEEALYPPSDILSMADSKSGQFLNARLERVWNRSVFQTANELRLLHQVLDHVERNGNHWYSFTSGALTELEHWDEQNSAPC